MRLVFIIACLLAITSADVAKLTSSDFYETILLSEGNATWFVMFEAPWCSQCRKLTKELQELERAHLGVKIASVDGNRNNDIAKHFGVNSYPMFIYIKGSTYAIYEGPRHGKAFIEFVRDTYRFVPKHPLNNAPSKFVLITKMLEDSISRYLNKSPLIICLVMFLIGAMIGAFLAVIGHMVLTEPIAIPTTIAQETVEEEESNEEKSNEEKEKQE